MAKAPAAKVTSKGICKFCKGEIEKGKMTQHLKSCKQRKANNANADALPAEGITARVRNCEYWGAE